MTLPDSNQPPEPSPNVQGDLPATAEPTPTAEPIPTAEPTQSQQQTAGDISVSGHHNAFSLVNTTGDVEIDQSQRDISINANLERSAVISGDGNTVTYTTNIFSAFGAESFALRPPQQLSKQTYRWRQVLVQNVQHYWIKGVLYRSLHNQALIELGLEERNQAIASPIAGAAEFTEDNKKPLPKGTKATDIFDSLGAGRTLLILGEPGAGKTTTLLKLAKTLLARIRDDLSQPIPVVLNLSSWAKKRRPIAEWLVQALYESFQVSKTLGTTWIEEEQLTLCLDGLDEVAAQHRSACVQALNQFLQTHGRTEVIVCSRIYDYEVLSERLRVRCAICVQPLTAQQLDQYLMQAGEHLSALSLFLNNHPDIKAFANSPLILSIMSLAYRGYSLEQLSKVGNAQAFQQRLFTTYVKRMLARRGSAQGYTEQQAQRWLSWIAQQMVRSSQTVFFIESLQPSWLATQRQRAEYCLVNFLVFGLPFGLAIGAIAMQSSDLSMGLAVGLSTGSIVGAFALVLDEINPTETLRWSWQSAQESFFKGAKIGLGLVLLIGLATTIIKALNGDLTRSLPAVLARLSLLALAGGLLIGVFGAISGGFRGPGMGYKTKPNQGIWKSVQNAGLSTLFGGLATGAFLGLTTEPLPGLLRGLFIWGPLFGLFGGGAACIRHFLLRVMLYRLQHSPWNYARFLDCAAEQLLLQKVGGGYIFVHRMLLEHFAQQELITNDEGRL